VFFRLAALALVLGTTVCFANQAPEAPVARAVPAKATVWFAREDSAMDRLAENASVTRRMTDALVRAATGQTTVEGAWKKLVAPGDRVGIKVNAEAGRVFSTRLGVVQAVVDGLKQAGIKPQNIVVWDRESAELRDAGFSPAKLGCPVRGIDPPKGWDRTASFAAPALGRLIWGDALFVEKNKKVLGKSSSDSDQLSSTSHFASIVTKDVTKIINLATLTDNAGCGVGGVFYNLCVRNVDNWRRFVSPETPAADALPELYASDALQPKVVLHLLDGLIAQYAGGPVGDPNYAYSQATLYASTDPVALDALAARRIEEWRRATKLPSIAKRTAWLEIAEQMGLGESAESRLQLIPVAP
jgi:hypothetical protein